MVPQGNFKLLPTVNHGFTASPPLEPSSSGFSRWPGSGSALLKSSWSTPKPVETAKRGIYPITTLVGRLIGRYVGRKDSLRRGREPQSGDPWPRTKTVGWLREKPSQPSSRRLPREASRSPAAVPGRNPRGSPISSSIYWSSDSE